MNVLNINLQLRDKKRMERDLANAARSDVWWSDCLYEMKIYLHYQLIIKILLHKYVKQYQRNKHWTKCKKSITKVSMMTSECLKTVLCLRKPDWSFNATTELFIPRQSWTIVALLQRYKSTSTSIVNKQYKQKQECDNW